ncbi:hypothetical protein B9Z55_021107 [Caenorhabditis nigoni]|uniref:F-box domain-containing protein n=1 Tax=Caenorhabditis nigoni TaxID=1611254 RepID=A0A2G5TQP2_9PELO|nr:hypothetical protein B9Z55_021107 [Caenorhabditis nigoni]
MPQILLTAPSTIRHFILYEAKRKTPIFEGFKNVSEVVGDENINFPEYQFWYYRFLSGNFDFEDDRCSISPPLTLLDLPMDSLAEIFSHLDVKNRMNVRKVSKSLRNVIDSQKIDYPLISIDIDEKSILLELNDIVFDYSDKSPPAWAPPNTKKIRISDKNHQKMALKDLENVLKSVKNVKDLHVVFYRSTPKSVFDSFVKVLENTKFDVEGILVFVEQPEDALKILNFFKPGKLESIHLESFERNGNLDDLVKMDQFKRAKEVCVEEYGILDPSLIDRFFGFDEFRLRLEDIRRENVIFTQSALEKLPNDREWTFYSDNLDPIEVEQAIDHIRVINHGDNFNIYYKLKIPNSEYFINIEFREENHLTMRKYN